uniref:Uncharacterized protein n=1 Tax=Caenorhabditis japonica TaxID=281687 RepID=A0A8R1IKB2_CAEJA
MEQEKKKEEEHKIDRKKAKMCSAVCVSLSLNLSPGGPWKLVLAGCLLPFRGPVLPPPPALLGPRKDTKHKHLVCVGMRIGW